MFKRVRALIAFVLVFSLSACSRGPAPAATVPPSAFVTPTEKPSSTPEDTFTPALAVSPTPGPSATSTPPPPGELLARIGKGEVLFYVFSPDGKTLAVLTPLKREVLHERPVCDHDASGMGGGMARQAF